MKNQTPFRWLTSCLFVFIFNEACNKPGDDGPKAPVLPTVTTSAVTNVGLKSADLGGTVDNNGGDSVTERGICYSTTEMPTVAQTKLASGSDTGNFRIPVQGLLPKTKYYARAYAVNSVGTAYGNQVSFQTMPVDSAVLIFIGGNNNLYCLSSDSAKLKWAIQLGGPVNSSPFYANGMVFVGCDDGKLYAFDTTGNLKWSVHTGARIGYSSPVVSKGVVFIANGLSVLAFNAVTGALNWKFDHNNGSSCGPVLANNSVYINAGIVYCLNEQTGAVNWSIPMNQQTILPKVSGNRFYTIYGNDYTMRVLDAITGAQISSLYIDVADPVSINVAKGTIYVCLDKGIWALDSVTLATKWVRGRYMYASSCQSGSSPVITDSIVHVVSAISGNVEQMRTRDGGFIDNYGKDLVGGDVTVVNSVSYFGSRDIFNVLNGFVYGVQLPSRESWRGPVVADYSTTPCVVTKSGKMYRAGDLY